MKRSSDEGFLAAAKLKNAAMRAPRALRFSVLAPFFCCVLCLPIVAGCRNGGSRRHAASASTKKPASPQIKSGRAIFRDVAQEAGLAHFRMGHGGRTPLDIRDTAGGGGGFVDFDRDGLLDVILVGERIGLFRNKGNGTFTDVSLQSGLTARGALMGCAVGDFNNDGWPDIFVTGHGVARLYSNERGSQRTLFRDVTETAAVGPERAEDWATSAGFADLDGDGLLDLAVCRYVLFTPKTLRFCSFTDPGGRKIQAACPPFYYEAQTLRVFRNRGPGKRFEEVSRRFPGPHGNSLGLAFADSNDDGRMDLYVANDGEPGDLYQNQGIWKFENVGSASGTAFDQDGKEQAGMGVDWGDYDNDGRLDLIVATFQDEPRSLYRNEGEGLFSYASYTAGIANVTRPSLTFGLGYLDFDNDGHLDLMLANGHVQDNIDILHPPLTYAQPAQLFRSAGDGTFTDAGRDGGPVFARPIVGRALATGDYDNDGHMDALVVDLEGAPLLLHNEGTSQNHWLGVRLLTRSGRDAIGARVTLEMEDRTKRIAESQTCRSYLSAADPRVHFGLGDASVVKRLLVRWPGAPEVSVIRYPPTDRYITITQGAARVAAR